MNQIDKAFKLAYFAHQNQKDKAGEDYIHHPIRVASNFEDEDEIVTALLHDVIEDSDITYEALAENGINHKVIHALYALTKFKGETKRQNAERIVNSKSILAIKVKIADLTDNMDLNRLKEVNENDVTRWLQYLSVKSYLQEYLKTNEKQFC